VKKKRKGWLSILEEMQRGRKAPYERVAKVKPVSNGERKKKKNLGEGIRG